MQKTTRNRPWLLPAAIYFGVFLLLLLCNCLTPYMVDDFGYMYSYYDHQRIESLWDIVMSMRVHRYHMNGRIIAHTLAQFSLMTPAWMFDIANAAVFVAQIALLHRISMGSETRRNGMLVALFCGVWLLCPAFGQVYLWQDGACNYLWAVAASLLFLMPYVEAYRNHRQIRSPLGKALFLCLAFCMGAHSETVSAAAIFMATLLVLLMLLEHRQEKMTFWILAIVAAFVGYLSIYTAPAQWREKSAERNWAVLLQNFLDASALYWKYMGLLLAAFMVFLLINLAIKTEKRRVLLALVFFAGSLASNYIMVFASFYPTRSAIGAFVFLLAAAGILLYPLVNHTAKKRVWTLALVLLLLVTSWAMVGGLRDIYTTYSGIRDNVEEINRCKSVGILDIRLPVVRAKTKYSALDGLKYLDVESTETWPNKYMVSYYEVNSILGVDGP